MIFKSPRGEKLDIASVTENVLKFMEECPQNFYRVVIGSDSQARKHKDHESCTYVTAIVAHRVGEGARYFWSEEDINRVPSLREKIYSETYRSLETANLLVPTLHDKANKLNYDLEIHVDVGPKGPTRELIKEITGMVTGNGYQVRTKPESWVASSVADKHT